MMNMLSAEVQVLSYKLNEIRAHIERRLTVVDTVTKSELEYVLKLISRYEHVPAGWHLERPFVREEDKK